MTPKTFTVDPMDSVLQKSEAETVAQNIMRILARTGNTFRPLEWEEYKEQRLKDSNFTEWEKVYFDKAIVFCKNADTAILFSPVWKEAADK